MKKLDFELFDSVQSLAEESPRRRMHHDLRTSAEILDNAEEWEDQSQRMLNVMMRDTVIPVHRHAETNEVVIVMRGCGLEVTFEPSMNEIPDTRNLGDYPIPEGLRVTDIVRLVAGSSCSGVVVPRGAWHTFIPLEDGTVIFEAKDRKYDPVETEEIWGKG